MELIICWWLYFVMDSVLKPDIYAWLALVLLKTNVRL